MFANIRALLEFIKLLLSTYRYIAGEIDQAAFNSVVENRKKIHDKFIEADRLERMRLLRDKVK